MRRQLRFVGVGGQGVILAGEILAVAKIKEGGYGVKASTYTSQVRGGPTKVDILLDETEILFPYANEGEIEFMIATAQVSFNQFKEGVKEGGIIVVEPNLVKPSDEDRAKWKIIEIPLITIAKEEGDMVTINADDGTAMNLRVVDANTLEIKDPSQGMLLIFKKQ